MTTIAERAGGVLRPVSDAAARALSPWPDRVDGVTAWTKPTRGGSERSREYDERLYGGLLERWVASGGRDLRAAVRFLDDVRRASHAEILEHPEIYGRVDLSAYLVSVGDRLYAADVALFELFYRAFIVERLAAVRAEIPFETLLEIGCGDGTNLLNAYERLALSSIAGVDASPNAVAMLRRVADDVGLDGAFAVGDLRDTAVPGRLAPVASPWALLTVHTIQVVERVDVAWFHALVDLENPPAVGVHFEPVVWRDDEPGAFARRCARYAELNRYNVDFQDALDRAEDAGLITIRRLERRVLGATAFAPTSVVVWAPRAARR